MNTTIKSKKTVRTKKTKLIVDFAVKKHKVPVEKVEKLAVKKKPIVKEGERIKLQKNAIVDGMKSHSIALDALDPGAIITFTYTGLLANDSKPIVLYLGHNNRTMLVHGINLKYLDKMLFEKVRAFVLENRIELHAPQIFYKTKLKTFLQKLTSIKNISFYRTYKRDKVTNLKIYTVSIIDAEQP
jgi:hypothetical protein